MTRLGAVAIAALIVARPDFAVAQADTPRFELGVHVPVINSREFDEVDVGIGARFAWLPAGWIGIESEVSLYPREFPSAGAAFSRRRVEGFFGVTFGPELARVRPFAKFRSGFLNVQQAPGPLACILIFPPPLSCELAAGDTLIAFDIGGGVELFTSTNTLVRIEAGDRPVRYPGPVFDSSRTRRDTSFFSHDFRFVAGAGLRF